MMSIVIKSHDHRAIPNNLYVFGFDNAPQAGERLCQAIRRGTAGQALNNDMGGSGSLLQGQRYPHHGFPLLFDNIDIGTLVEDRGEYAV